MTHSLLIAGKKIDIFAVKNAPLVILNTYGGEGEAVWQECAEAHCPPFSLAAISRLDWEKDMSPWENPPLSKSDAPFSGGADAYLYLLTQKIVPAVCDVLNAKPRTIALAGYSLAGLFSLYAAYKTPLFCRIASVSPSLWFPDFVPFAKNTPFVRNPDCIYLSLGDKEAKTRNPLLQSVQKNTEDICAWYAAQKIPVIFELKGGNHFTDSEKRTARGIQWILEH